MTRPSDANLKPFRRGRRKLNFAGDNVTAGTGRGLFHFVF